MIARNTEYTLSTVLSRKHPVGLGRRNLVCSVRKEDPAPLILAGTEKE